MTKREEIGLNYILGRFEGIANAMDLMEADKGTMKRARDALLETCTMLQEWIAASEVEGFGDAKGV